MPLSCKVRLTRLRHLLLWFALLVLDPGPGLAYARTQPRSELAAKTILVLHAFESTIPAFSVTDKGISETLQAGGVSNLNQFFEL